MSGRGSDVSIWLIIFFIVLFFVTIGLTYYAYHLEEKKMEKYEEESPEEALARSHEYETKSLQTSMRVQIWYYFIAVAIMAIGLVIFVRFVIL